MEKILSILLICAVAAVAHAEVTMTAAPLAGIHAPELILQLAGLVVGGGVVMSLLARRRQVLRGGSGAQPVVATPALGVLANQDQLPR